MNSKSKFNQYNFNPKFPWDFFKRGYNDVIILAKKKNTPLSINNFPFMLSGSYTLDILFFFFILSVFSFFSLAPWCPTRRVDFERINKVIKLKKGERLLEMGCGDSRVGLYLAQENPTAHIVGIELSPVFYLISKIRVWLSGLGNIKVIYGNALNLELKSFDVIYIFGLPETVSEKVAPKLKNRVKESMRFISYSFRMSDDFFAETKYTHKDQSNIYEYRLRK